VPIKATWILFRKEIIEALSTTETGVYEIGRARGNVVLYIGKSDKSVRSRLLTHKGKTAFAACTHFRKRKTKPDDAAKAEAKLLSDFKKTHGRYPELNKNKPPQERDFVRKLLFG
jgi:hypothetical protein